MPVMRLASVVLPAPLGPISPRISPASTARLTRLVARTPPKRLLRSWVSISAAIDRGSGLAPALAEQSGRTKQQHQQHQQEAIGVLVGCGDEGGAQRFDD